MSTDHYSPLQHKAPLPTAPYRLREKRRTDTINSGLAWHTEEGTLRQKFEEFGAVEEAVSFINFFVVFSVSFASAPIDADASTAASTASMKPCPVSSA